MFDVKQALRELVDKHGSDLHLKAGAPPLYRVNGELSGDEGAAPLSAEETETALHQLLGDETKLEEFAAEHEVDFSFEIHEVARFRVNAFRQRGLVSIACRAIPHKISTIEDPIEFLHRDKQSIINQREVGDDTASFARALRRVLRQDPDVILIGEMRDEETVHTALSAAETGHLVLSTIHTVDA